MIEIAILPSAMASAMTRLLNIISATGGELDEAPSPLSSTVR